MKKRILTLSLALIFTLALFIPAYAAESETLASQGFDDIAPGSWCDEAARWAVEKGITNGTGGNNFSPTRTCSRAEIITFLWRAAGAPVGFDVGYSDVPDDAYFTSAAAWCKAKQLITDDAFDGNADCTRADVVTYLWTLAEQPPAPYKYAVLNHHTLFEDIDANGELIDPVLWAVAYDITTGTSETTFSPDNTCTRGEIVTFLQRAYSGDAMVLNSERFTDEILTLEEFYEQVPKGNTLQLGYSNEGLDQPGLLKDCGRWGGVEYLEQERYVDLGNGVIAKARTEFYDNDGYVNGYRRGTTLTVVLKPGDTLTIDMDALQIKSPHVYDDEVDYCTFKVDGSKLIFKANYPGFGVGVSLLDEDIETGVENSGETFLFAVSVE